MIPSLKYRGIPSFLVGALAPFFKSLLLSFVVSLLLYSLALIFLFSNAVQTYPSRKYKSAAHAPFPANTLGKTACSQRPPHPGPLFRRTASGIGCFRPGVPRHRPRPPAGEAAHHGGRQDGEVSRRQRPAEGTALGAQDHGAHRPPHEHRQPAGRLLEGLRGER